MSTNKNTFTKIDKAIVKALQGAETPLTTAQIAEIVGPEFKTPHISAAVRKGLIENCGKIAIPATTKREVSVYKLVTTEELKNDKDKVFNYTDGEKRILETLVALGDMENITLADIAAAMQVEKLSSGAITGLVNKGNIKILGKIKIDAATTSKVSIYVVAAELPEGFSVDAE